jgi:hypothetical protein
LTFISKSGKRVELKFEQLLEVLMETKVVHSNFIKKLSNSKFHELRIKAGNEYRIILFAIDHMNFNESEEVILLNGFLKKSNKDYVKAIRIAENLLEEYLKERNHGKDN